MKNVTRYASVVRVAFFFSCYRMLISFCLVAVWVGNNSPHFLCATYGVRFRYGRTVSVRTLAPCNWRRTTGWAHNNFFLTIYPQVKFVSTQVDLHLKQDRKQVRFEICFSMLTKKQNTKKKSKSKVVFVILYLSADSDSQRITTVMSVRDVCLFGVRKRKSCRRPGLKPLESETFLQKFQAQPKMAN